MKTRDLIFEKALILFAQRGYAGASVRDICREVGIKESSFYNHYPSKESLLEFIFEACNQAMLSSVMTQADRERLTDMFTLRQFLTMGLDKYIEMWGDPKAAQIWFTVSMEQYRNEKAGILIMEESIRRVTGLAAIFDLFQMKEKMKACNSLEAAHLYAYSIRAQHLDFGLRGVHSKSPEQARAMMYRTCDFFCSLFEPI